MKLGYFTVDNENTITAFTSETLNFSRMDTEFLRWHREGRVLGNDTVIFIGKNLKSNVVEKMSGSCPCINGLSDDVQNIIIFKYDTESIPFSKELVHDDDEEKLVDTMYSGTAIRLESVNDDCYSLDVNGRKIILHKSMMTDKVAVIFTDDGGVKYFDFFDYDDIEMNLLLEGKTYSPKIYIKDTIKLCDLFDENMQDAIQTAIKNGECTTSDAKVTVKKLQKYFFNKGDTLLSIGDEHSYLNTIKNCTKTYDDLYFGRRIKSSHNELECDARLQGSDKQIEKINEKLEKVCKKNVTIVLTGESGTGKTYLAKQIHKNSRRATGPFINVNCAAISYNLIESELFGYEEGAFTGARKGGKIGYFELAKGGTLFLDEISELPINLQGKLLEVLQDGTFYRVGGVKKISADMRLIVATNKDLKKMVKNNSFREDLYYRINVFPIHLPPLRERLVDLYSIIDDTLPAICKRLEIESLMVTAEAVEKMKSYSWPGNIRELENVLEKAAVMADENFIREKDVILDNNGIGNYTSSTLKEKMNDFEREIILNAIERFNGNRKQIAEYLGISKTNLFEKIHKYELDNKVGYGEL